VVDPPYSRRPTIRFAYWTGIRRWDCSTNTTARVMSRMTSSMMVRLAKPLAPPASEIIWAGKDATIDVKMSSDIPLPTPRSVISSPSHMIRPVPAVMASTTRNRFHGDSSGIGLTGQPGYSRSEMARVTTVTDCRRPSPSVR